MTSPTHSFPLYKGGQGEFGQVGLFKAILREHIHAIYECMVKLLFALEDQPLCKILSPPLLPKTIKNMFKRRISLEV